MPTYRRQSGRPSFVSACFATLSATRPQDARTRNSVTIRSLSVRQPKGAPDGAVVVSTIRRSVVAVPRIQKDLASSMLVSFRRQ